MGTTVAAVALVALAGVAMGAMRRRSHRLTPARRARRPAAAWGPEPTVPPSEAERRSLELLRSVINPDEWRMYTELGFLCVTGRRFRRDGREALPRYRYLIYPHLPLVALLPRSMAPVREYCIEFPDLAVHGQDGQLPTGDDLLAKWMTVRADEDRLHAFANVCNAGCQIPLSRIERDLRRLTRWESVHAPSSPAPAISARY